MAKQISTILSLKDKMSQPLVKVSKNVDKVTRDMKKSQNQINKWKKNSVKAIDDVVKKTVKAGAAIGAAVTGYGIKTAIDLEDAFSGVRKTVDATEEEFTQIRSELNNLAMNEIPIAVDELYGIAESAGQLGIATENVTEFSDTMAKLGVATNMTSEQASTDLARLANITQMPQTEFDRLGSTVVELGNNLATTESEIVSMSLELAGSAKQIGMTEADMLAMSGAMSSVGIASQRGGSSMSRVIQKINTEVLSVGDNLDGFAKVAEMSAKDFSKAWQDKPTEAITALVKGLGNINQSGGDVTSTLKELGINSTQEIDTLLRLAGASDVLTNAIGMSSDAWDKNTALNEEAEEKFSNTKSQLALLKNNFVLVADSIGQIFLPYINDAVEALIPFIQKIGDSKDRIKEVIEQIVEWLTNIINFIREHEKLITTIGVFVAGMYAAIKVISIVTTVITVLKTASLLLNGTLAATPIGWLVVGIGAVIAAGYALYRNWDLVKEKAGDLSYGVQAAFSNMGTGIMNALKGIGNFFINYVINPIANGLNSLSFDIPDWVPKFGGKTFGFNIETVSTFDYGSYKSLSRPSSAGQSVITESGQQLSTYADGTSYSPAGYARIHEEGGEIRKLSSGETIIPADKSERLLRGKGTGQDANIIIKILGNVVGNKEFIDEIGYEVYAKVKLALENM